MFYFLCHANPYELNDTLDCLRYDNYGKSISQSFRSVGEEVDLTNPRSNTMIVDGSIEFENVNFSYNKNPDNLILKDINLKIKSGQMVGIIGATGSAKTTLVQLIPGFMMLIVENLKSWC